MLNTLQFGVQKILLSVPLSLTTHLILSTCFLFSFPLPPVLPPPPLPLPSFAFSGMSSDCAGATWFKQTREQIKVNVGTHPYFQREDYSELEPNLPSVTPHPVFVSLKHF